MSLCEIIQNEYSISSENEVVNDERNCETISTSGDNCVINESGTYILFPVYVRSIYKLGSVPKDNSYSVKTNTNAH